LNRLRRDDFAPMQGFDLLDLNYFLARVSGNRRAISLFFAVLLRLIWMKALDLMAMDHGSSR
jgi:hypothetical protein